MTKHDRDTERLGSPDLAPELAAWIDHYIAEGECILAHPDCDAAQAGALKSILSILEQAREGDAHMLRIARMMARDRP